MYRHLDDTGCLFSFQGHANYLLPFFCLQVFDFVITSLSGVSHFAYNRSTKSWITTQTGLPCKEWLLQQDEDVLMLGVLLFFIAVIIIKVSN